MTRTIRPATVEDASACAAIYAPIVLNTHTSFEMEPPDETEMGRRIAKTLSNFPWLVCLEDEFVLGYAYAGRHRERFAYQWTVESSVYVHPGSQGKGVGKSLYQALFNTLRMQGFVMVYAGIALPNDASIGLHASMGFEPIGIYRAAGYKFGKWHDVVWNQMALREPEPEPRSPVPFSQTYSSSGFQAITNDSGVL